MPVTVGHDNDSNDDDDADVTSLFFNGTELVRCSHNDNACVSAPAEIIPTPLAKLRECALHSPSVSQMVTKDITSHHHRYRGKVSFLLGQFTFSKFIIIPVDIF